MKLITKIVLVLLLIGLFLPLWLKDPSGQPLMTPADWARVPERLGAIIDRAGEMLERLPAADSGAIDPSGAAPPAAGEYYRWQDDAGAWHFSDQPPPDSVTKPVAQQLPEVHNRMDGMEATELTSGSVVEPPLPAAGTGPALDSSISPPLPEGVSKEAIEQLLQDAHERRMGEHL